jgi:hypothetical protein
MQENPKVFFSTPLGYYCSSLYNLACGPARCPHGHYGQIHLINLSTVVSKGKSTKTLENPQ